MKNDLSSFRNRALLGIVISIGATISASPVQAQCSAMTPKTAIAWQAVPAPEPLFQPALRTAGVEPQDRGNDAPDPSIVGLWQVTFMSGGQVVDQAFETFGSDGNELMVDTAAPSTGNVCNGVWARIAPLTYRLNHPSWTFDANGNLNGTATIRVTAKLDPRGNSFTGTVTVDVLTLAGQNVQHLTGTVTAKRITAN